MATCECGPESPPRLSLLPEQSGYNVTHGEGVIRTVHGGGLGRYRRDIVGAPAIVSVEWSLNPSQYDYLMAFYRRQIDEGAKPFNVMLVYQRYFLASHLVHILPGSFRTIGTTGQSYRVAAELEVEPNEISEAFDTFNEFMFRHYSAGNNEDPCNPTTGCDRPITEVFEGITSKLSTLLEVGMAGL